MAGPLRLRSAPLKAQLGNKVDWNEERSLDDADFFTIGYAGRTLPDFLVTLKAAHVSSVIDVRQNPVSMYKPDFSKRNLQNALEAEGIEYQHRPELGVPRDIRSLAIAQDNREGIWEWYDSYVVGQSYRNLHSFFNSATHPVALLCVELDPTSCHRHRLALALERAGLRGYDL